MAIELRLPEPALTRETLVALSRDNVEIGPEMPRFVSNAADVFRRGKRLRER